MKKQNKDLGKTNLDFQKANADLLNRTALALTEALMRLKYQAKELNSFCNKALEQVQHCSDMTELVKICPSAESMGHLIVSLNGILIKLEAEQLTDQVQK